MIEEELSLGNKFKLVKELGLHGVELARSGGLLDGRNSRCKGKTGIELSTVVNKDHWSSPLSEPDPEVRRRSIRSMAAFQREVKEFSRELMNSKGL